LLLKLYIVVKTQVLDRYK